MQGGTTFTFVTGGIEAALAQARAAAGTGTVAGGAATVNQYLAAALIDDLWLHIAPVTLGAGERLFDGVALTPEPLAARHTDLVTHVRYRGTALAAGHRSITNDARQRPPSPSKPHVTPNILICAAMTEAPEYPIDAQIGGSWCWLGSDASYRASGAPRR